MKRVIALAAGCFLLSFAPKPQAHMDGVWMGELETESSMEDVTLKFDDDNKALLFRGPLSEGNKINVSYAVEGDSVLIVQSLQNSSKQLRIKGHFNRKMTYVDGTWESTESPSANFYMRKQEIREYIL